MLQRIFGTKEKKPTGKGIIIFHQMEKNEMDKACRAHGEIR
jgi:hypothetical protein